MGNEKKPGIAGKKSVQKNLPKAALGAVHDAGVGVQNAGKAIVKKGQDLVQLQVEKVERRQDELYASNRQIGVEQLERLRALQPGASPLTTWNLLALSFIEGVSRTKDEEVVSSLHREFVLTAIEIYGGPKVGVQVRRECIGLIEVRFRNFKIKKNAGKAINAVITLADIAVTFIPGLQNAKFLKNAKFLNAKNLTKLIQWISRIRPFVDKAKVKIDEIRPDERQAHRMVQQVKDKLGAMPSSWPRTSAAKKA
jgi:hypothetical protein